jgi:ketosteroid isomerase-like protein
MTNQELIEHFYTSFAKADVEGMLSCYDDAIEFEDPAFGKLKGEEAKNMWRMLVKPGLQLTFNKVWADDEKGGAHWDAKYVFSKTGRNVLNKIDAEFQFKNGKIIKHKDTFDMWKWSKQALGLPGLLLGWSPLLKNKVHSQALDQLRKFSSKRP